MSNKPRPAPVTASAVAATLLAVAPSTPVVDQLLARRVPSSRIGTLTAWPSDAGREMLAASAAGAIALAHCGDLDVETAARLAVDSRVTVRDALWENLAVAPLVARRPHLLAAVTPDQLSVDMLVALAAHAPDLVALDVLACVEKLPDRKDQVRYLRAVRRAVAARGDASVLVNVVANGSVSVARAVTPVHARLGVPVADLVAAAGGPTTQQARAVVAGWFDLVGSDPVPDELVDLMYQVHTRGPATSPGVLTVRGSRAFTSAQVATLVTFRVGACLVVDSADACPIADEHLDALVTSALMWSDDAVRLMGSEVLASRLTSQQADALAASVGFMSAPDTRAALRARTWSSQAIAGMRPGREVFAELFDDVYELNLLTWDVVLAMQGTRERALMWCEANLPANTAIGPGAGRIWDALGTWTLAQATRPDGHEHLLEWVRDLANAHLGSEPEVWTTALRLAESWPGTLSELFTTAGTISAS